jgi:hypothetical protein
MKTFLLSLLLAVSLFSFAQRRESSISIGPSIGMRPDLRGNWGSGASLRGYIGTTKRGAVLLNSNVIFYPSSYEDRTWTVSMLKVGYKTQFLHPNLFVYGDAGVTISYGTPWKEGADPAAGVGVGYSIPVGERKYIDIVPGWNFRLRHYAAPWITRSSHLELHLAYRFAFR